MADLNLLTIQLQQQWGVSVLKGWGSILQDAAHALHQRLLYNCVSSRVRIHGTWNQGVEVRVAPPLTITLNDALTKMLHLVPVTLRSIGLESLVSKGSIFLPTKGHNDGLIEIEDKSATLPFWLLMPLNQQA